MKARKRERQRQRGRAREQRAKLRNALLALLALAAVPFIVYGMNRPSDPLAPAETIALGAEVYAESCASCHGEEGEGHAEVALAPALDASEHAWHHPDGQLRDQIANGSSLMPAFRDQLDDEEMVAVIRFMQTWWTADQLAAQQRASQANPLD